MMACNTKVFLLLLLLENLRGFRLTSNRQYFFPNGEQSMCYRLSDTRGDMSILLNCVSGKLSDQFDNALTDYKDIIEFGSYMIVNLVNTTPLTSTL